jgi:integrase
VTPASSRAASPNGPTISQTPSAKPTSLTASWTRGAPAQSGGSECSPDRCPWLIQLYRQDARFTDLATLSQQAYDYHLRTIEAWSERAGHPPITTIERRHVKKFARSMAATPGKAQQVIGVLRTLFAFAMDEGELAVNHATNMRLKSNPPRYHIWTDEQVAALIQTSAGDGRPSVGLAVALAHNTGQREGDILRMGWSQFDGSVIRLRQRKTGVLLDVPCTAQLLEVLATTPRRGTVMVISETTGRPYGRSWFAEAFRVLARAAGIPDDLQFRDLRRTSVVRLAEAGCSVPEIAAISGHAINRTAKILEVYCPRNSTMARHAITRLEDYRRNVANTKLEG